MCWYQMSRTNESVDMNYISECLGQSNSCTQETSMQLRSMHCQIWYLVKTDSWLIEVIFPLSSYKRSVKGYLGPLLWSTNPILNHESPPARPHHLSKVTPPKTYAWIRLQLLIGSGHWDSNQPLPTDEKVAGGRQREADLRGLRVGLVYILIPCQAGLYSQTLSREKERRQRQTDRSWDPFDS